MPQADTDVVGIELGGTKSLAVLATGATIVDRFRVPTTDPATTLAGLAGAVDAWRAAGRSPTAIGIGSFGPVGLDPNRADFGHITATPKPGWSSTDVRGYFAERFDVPIGFDTDTTGAALAEWRWGGAVGCGIVTYLTIGTGIGGGVIVDGVPVHGLVHPEVGHLRVRRRAGDDFAGACPFHGDCIEGLASGPAIAARAGRPAPELPPDHPVWDDVGDELAELVAILLLVISPHRVLIGGGVSCGQPFLIDRVRQAVVRSLGGYVSAVDSTTIGHLVALPALGDDAGPLGSVALAHAADR